MHYNTLGKSGMKVSHLGLGAMLFGWRTAPQEAMRIMDVARDAGINVIDTSDSYGRGRSEEIIGEAIAAGGRRDHMLLATKFRLTADAGCRDGSAIVRACEESLKRLRTDRIDLYQLHFPHPDVPAETVLRAMEDLIRSGKVVHSGICNFPAWQVLESFRVADQCGTGRFVSNQIPYNLLDRSAERELLPMASALGHGVIVYCALAEGILTGKYRRSKPLPEDSRYANIDKPGFHRERLTFAVHDAVQKLEALAACRGVALYNYCLAWVLARPEVACTLIGPATVAQLQDCLLSQGIDFTDSDQDDIDSVIPPGAVLSPFVVTSRARTSSRAH